MPDVSGFFRQWTNRSLAGSCLVLILVSSNLNWSERFWPGILEADAKGYYAWLPAVFIYSDLHFGFFEEIEEKHRNLRWRYEYRVNHPSGTTNKYFCGTAALEAPFFFVAHCITLISGGDADGYTYWYPVLINIAAVFYALAGLYLLGRFLSGKKISDPVTAAVLIALLFGTNLFYYSVVEPGMSHVYSFFCVTGFLRTCQRWFQNGERKNIVYAAIFLGLIVLIRPVNILIIGVIPLAAQSWGDFQAGLKKIFRKPQLQFSIIGLLCFGCITGIQFLFYYLQTGSAWVDAYGDERFYFNGRHFFDFLFSFKKGAFLYIPLLLVALAGLVPLIKKDKFQGYWLIAWLIVLVFVLSSWWSWWYGGSFGSRVLVEYLPVFGLLLGCLLELYRTTFLKIALILLVGFCQFQTYQYRYFLIHWEDMTKEKYFNVFMKLPG